MPRFVIVGSCRHEPYTVLAMPKKLTDTPHTTEEGYVAASKIFFPAIDSLSDTDAVIIWAPDGIGLHTLRDIEYAKSKGKRIYRLVEMKETGQDDEHGAIPHV